jgi:hypothetical protein
MSRDEELRRALAELEHDRWSRWMRFQFSLGIVEEDGTWRMPAALVERWRRQMDTPYVDLTEIERHSDLAEADRSLEIIEGYLLKRVLGQAKPSGE